MKIVRVTGGDILSSLTSEQLLDLAILKMHMEGKDWRQVANEFPTKCWDMLIAFNEEETTHARNR